MIVSPSVSLLLPVSVLGLSHIPELITAYLLPRTIDAAVYKDLHTVVEAYGDVLPWTYEAMDGASARGRLDICRILQSNRTEGCSDAAFTGASLNDDVETLQWLSEHFPDWYYPEECLTAAVDAGQAKAVRFLNQQLGVYDKASYLNTAAGKGSVEVVSALRPWGINRETLGQLLCLAATNGHEEVYYILIRTITWDEEALELNSSALEVAVKSGQARMVKQLLRKGVSNVNCVLVSMDAAEFGHADVMEVLLTESYCFGYYLIPPIVAIATENDHCAVVECLLRHFPDKEEETIEIFMLNRSICRSLSATAQRGSIEMVKALLGRCHVDALGEELKEAGTAGNFELTKVLLSECERRHLDNWIYRDNVATAVQKAARRGDQEIAKLFIDQCFPPTEGPALMSAVENKDLKMVELLASIKGVPGRNKLRALGRTIKLKWQRFCRNVKPNNN